MVKTGERNLDLKLIQYADVIKINQEMILFGFKNNFFYRRNL